MRTNKEQRQFRASCYQKHRRPNPAGHGWVLDCAECGRLVGDGISLWEADHIVAHALNPDNSPSNSQVLCIPCHRRKYVVDRRLTDKSRRLEKQTMGIKRKSRPMAGTRASGIRRRMNGTVESW